MSLNITAKASAIQVENSLIKQIRQITFAGTKTGEGYYSIDGKKMIFQSDRDESNPFYQMYIVDLITGQTERLSTGTGKTTCGWIHPNLKQTLWSSTHKDKGFKSKVTAELESRKKSIKDKYSWSFDENFDIFSSDLKGKNIKQLTNELGYDAEASYSNDGQWIAFASNRLAYDKVAQKTWSDIENKMFKQDPSYFMDIYIMKSDGSQVKRLTTTPGYDGGPFFSADSKKITWRKFTPDGSKAEIYTMNVDGTDQKQVTRLNAMSWAPFFHPSGQYIIFTSSVLGYHNFELYIVDTEGKKDPVRVSYLDGFDGLPTFSPNGFELSWTRKNEKGESQIYTAEWAHHAALASLGLVDSNHSNTLLTELNPLKQTIQFLASESMQGRMTGSPQESVYMDELSKKLNLWGLKTHKQAFTFTSKVNLGEKNQVKIKGNINQSLDLGSDYQVISNSQSGQFNDHPIVFAGYGIVAPAGQDFVGYNSYRDLDVKDKWVLLIDGQPLPEERNIKIHSQMLPYSGLQHKITTAKNKGAYGIIIADLNSDMKFGFQGRISETTVPVIKISKTIFKKLILAANATSFEQITKDMLSYKEFSGFIIGSTYLSADIDLKTETKTAHNLIAILHPKNKIFKKNKSIIIGAHGDHLGFNETGSSLAKDSKQKIQIHYGADDNASGVAGVMSLAEYFSQKTDQLKQPLYFAIWSGEEIGTLGSTAFVKNFKNDFNTKKSFKDSFLASLNMDMIGRLNDQKQLYVQGIGSSKYWTQVIESIMLSQLKPDLQLITSSDPYLPTDSMSLYLGEIPSISFFTGAHNEYHTPKDTAETINYVGLESVINTVKSFVEALNKTSNIDTKLTYNHVESQSKNMEGRKFRIFLGTVPDYTQEGTKGVKISGASKDSPAEKAGLKSGDIIVEFDKVKIDNIYDYVYTLQTVKPNIKTQIKVIRDSKAIDLEITPTVKE